MRFTYICLCEDRGGEPDSEDHAGYKGPSTIYQPYGLVRPEIGRAYWR